MENVLFYTFSTIAATFGSAVGIIVAAAIFRMQRIDQIAAGLASEMMKYHPEDRLAPPQNLETEISRLNRILVVQDWEKFFRVWGEYHPGTPPSQNPQEAHLNDLLGKIIEKKQKIRRSVRNLVIATVLLIGICFTEIATTRVILAWMVTCNIPLAVTLLFAFCILVGYAKVTNLLLSRPVDYSDD